MILIMKKLSFNGVKKLVKKQITNVKLNSHVLSFECFAFKNKFNDNLLIDNQSLNDMLAQKLERKIRLVSYHQVSIQ